MKIKRLFTAITSALMCILPASAQTGTGLATTTEQSGFVPEGYEMVWNDEFEGTELSTDWKFEIQNAGWVNHELQRYVGKNYRGNKVVSVEDGRLSIKCQKVGDEIVSGRINAKPSEGWCYGYFEARIKLPKGKGTWPAFWMMPVGVDWNTTPWPNCGEIDIMEEVGCDPNIVSSSIHCESYNHTKNTQKTHALTIPTAESEYHVYAVEWTEKKLHFFVDGKEQLLFKRESYDHAVWPFHYAFYPILNLAWGGDWGGYKGVDNNVLPCEMLVDYVRIYQKPRVTPQKKIVAYVTSWSSIMPDPNMMTHINYAFGGVGGDYRSVYVDNESRFKQIIKLKERNPDLKIMLSVGGWGRGNFSPMAKDADNRLAFAKACRSFCEKYGIDGIDIDWEFPGSNSSGEASPSNEKQNYTLLMRDLREALGDDYLLTMASSSEPGRYDYRNCIQYLDFVNVMTYDMASAPNHHSALYRGGTVGNGYIVMHESIKNHLNAGIPRDKLVMGLAFYANGGPDGQISLQQVENNIASGKWVDHWDDVAKVPYVTDNNGKFVYGYDNARSLSIKCQYIMENELAGGMYWEYANDNNVGIERTTVYECLSGKPIEKKDVRLNDVQLDYLGGDTYGANLDMVQGALYMPTGSDDMTSAEWFYDPDFFLPKDNGYVFQAINGKYRVEADFVNQCFKFVPLNAAGNYLTYNQSKGTGCVWLIGANTCYGKPLHESGYDTGWSEGRAIPLSPVAPNRHQITFEVGKQLNPNHVNFKFFHQNGWGGEFNSNGEYKISTTSELFMVNTASSDNGNIMLRSGKSVKEGEVYVFTVDTTNPKNAVLLVDTKTTGIETVTVMPADSRIFDLQGRQVKNARRGLYITNGKKHVVR